LVSRVVGLAMCLALFGAVVGMPTVAEAVPVPWLNCGSSTDLVAVQQVDASVWPPQSGKPITLSIKFMLKQSITGGSADVVLSAPQSLSKFPHVVAPGFARVFPIPPMAAGPYHPQFPPGSNGITFTVPFGLSGTVYTLHIDEHDVTGAPLICLNMTIPVK
jgi:hypothetical protein